MIGVDLFSGAGGMSLGAEMSGITVKYAVESNPHAAHTYARNHCGVTVLQRRIETITKADFNISRDQPLIVFGGPPCRGFSTSNQRTRSALNPDNWLFEHYLRVVRTLRPDWVVFENVTGILQTEKGRFLQTVIRRLEKYGYTVEQWVLNAADYGVPQRRTRLFLIGSLYATSVHCPSPHNVPVTVSHAISDLPELRNGAATNWLRYRTCPTNDYARSMRGTMEQCANHLVTRNQPLIIKRYAHVPPGGNWECIPPKLMRNYSNRTRCHEWIYRRLRPDEPSVVIGNFRKNMLIHPSQDRGLSVREAARLQSFPDSFEFTGSIGFQQQQVGNAVPPLLARALFTAIVRAANGDGARIN